MSIRVAIVDDQALMRDGFSMILDAQPDIDVVGEARTAGSAVELCLRTRPDVVLMDIRMPVLDGIEATRLITAERWLQTKVLVLTTFDLDEYVYAALRAGASGYMLKDTPAEELRRRGPRHRPGRRAAVAVGDAAADRGVRRRRNRSRSRRPSRRPTDREQKRSNCRTRVSATARSPRDVHRRGDGQDPRQPAAHQARRSRSVQAVVLAYETGLVRPGVPTKRDVDG